MLAVVKLTYGDIMTKEEIKNAISVYPNSPEIERFGYYMLYDAGRNAWLAVYDGDKGSTWYIFKDDKFEMITRLGKPWNGKTYELKELKNMLSD